MSYFSKVKIDPTANGVTLSAPVPAGFNNIGDVDLASPIPAGANLIGSVRVSDQATLAFSNLVGSATTTIKAGAGKLCRIIINNATGGIATIYDNIAAAGTKIGTLVLGSALPSSLEYGCPFTLGLTIVTTGANTDITVVYE